MLQRLPKRPFRTVPGGTIREFLGRLSQFPISSPAQLQWVPRSSGKLCSGICHLIKEIHNPYKFYTLFIWCMKRDPTLKSEGRSFISLELRTSNPRPSRSRFVREILRDCRGLGCFQLPPVASGLRSRSGHFSGAGCCRDLHSASYRISFPPTAMDRGMEGVVRFQILMFHERRGSHFEHSASA